MAKKKDKSEKDKFEKDKSEQDKSETHKTKRELLGETWAESQEEIKAQREELAKAESEQLHPLETITSILLIRHGHTEATELGLLYSDPHMPLTEKGVAQSKLAAKWATRFKPDVILTGNARRVAQAAEPLAHLTGLTPIVTKGFEEWQV